MPYIGSLKLQQIHSGVLDEFIRDREEAKISAGTLTRDLAVVRRILTLAARLWRDENGKPWLDSVPLLQEVEGERRKPRPISWEEQERLLPALPKYLRDMVLFGLNTGLRVQEICGLKWSDEFKLSGTDISVLVVTEIRAKNKHEWVIPLNTIARALVRERRGNGSEYVFDFRSRKLARMTNRAWNKAIKETDLTGVRVHDMRHTFGKRLRAAHVSFEDRQDLLCHYSGHITTHYSKVEILHLIDCVELLCQEHKPELTLVRKSG
jgi:integrase